MQFLFMYSLICLLEIVLHQINAFFSFRPKILMKLKAQPLKADRVPLVCMMVLMQFVQSESCVSLGAKSRLLPPLLGVCTRHEERTEAEALFLEQPQKKIGPLLKVVKSGPSSIEFSNLEFGKPFFFYTLQTQHHTFLMKTFMASAVKLRSWVLRT